MEPQHSKASLSHRRVVWHRLALPNWISSRWRLSESPCFVLVLNVYVRIINVYDLRLFIGSKLGILSEIQFSSITRRWAVGGKGPASGLASADALHSHVGLVGQRCSALGMQIPSFHLWRPECGGIASLAAGERLSAGGGPCKWQHESRKRRRSGTPAGARAS